MSQLTPTQVAASDPLREVTKREGRLLVLVSLLTLALVWGGFVPTEIQALGIKLTQGNQQALVLLLAAACLFLACTYTVSLASDFASWHFASRAAHKHWHAEKAQSNELRSNLIAQAEFVLDSRTRRLANFVARTHARTLVLVHFIAPMLLALVAISASIAHTVW